MDSLTLLRRELYALMRSLSIECRALYEELRACVKDRGRCLMLRAWLADVRALWRETFHRHAAICRIQAAAIGDA
jgi:hypothetical protein